MEAVAAPGVSLNESTMKPQVWQSLPYCVFHRPQLLEVRQNRGILHRAHALQPKSWIPPRQRHRTTRAQSKLRNFTREQVPHNPRLM